MSINMENEHREISEAFGVLWTWWKGDALPQLQPLSNFRLVTPTDVTLIAHLLETSTEYVTQRLQENHRPYVAYMDDTPVAAGWSATGQAEFADGLVHFCVPAKNRYFYFFVTLPEWRGRGIYAHLLQTILRIESVENERFWILHQFGNTASERGIAKAGFHLISRIHLLSDAGLCFVPSGKEVERARAGVTVFGLPLVLPRGTS
jgi:GNAT superfamily N-acetyltransferase